MNYTFVPKSKGKGPKSWSFIDDELIYNGEKIDLLSMKKITHIFKPSKFTNGVISIVDKKNNAITLAYKLEDKEMAEEVLRILNSKISENNAEETSVINLDKKSIDEVSQVSSKISGKKSMKEIEEDLKKLPYIGTFGIKKEIKELPKIIDKDEVIHALTRGALNEHTWIILCTNKRIIFLDKGMLFGLNMDEIPLSKVNAISHTKGLLMGKIFITNGAREMYIEGVPNDTISHFVENARKQCDLIRDTELKSEPLFSVADELLKFKELLDCGAITQEEFDRKKQDLLK